MIVFTVAIITSAYAANPPAKTKNNNDTPQMQKNVKTIPNENKEFKGPARKNGCNGAQTNDQTAPATVVIDIQPDKSHKNPDFNPCTGEVKK